MMTRFFVSLVLVFIAISCVSDTSQETAPYFIKGRNLVPTYQVEAPREWRFVQRYENLNDTTVPLAEFFLDDQVLITIHNFPTQQLSERIAPESQVARWTRQLKQVDRLKIEVIPQAFGGFSGQLVEAEGLMGWSMVISPLHYQNLNGPSGEQMRADYTIKVTGPAAAIRRHREQIYAFARSFSLIQEIPNSL